MNITLQKKIAAASMAVMLALLSGCSYDIPQGYTKKLHEYDAAVEYARSIDPEAKVSSDCEDKEEQTRKFRIWPAVINGVECSVASVATNVYNKGWAAGEFPVRYYRLDTDYDYYVVKDVLKSHPEMGELNEPTLWSRYEGDDLITSRIKKDDITTEEIDALWDKYRQVNKELEAYPVHKRFSLWVTLPNNYFVFKDGSEEEYLKVREKLVNAGILDS